MFDKVFKTALLIVAMLFLLICYRATKANRYEIVTQYEGSVGIFDNQQGVMYLLDLESDQWTVIRPFSKSRTI